MIWLLVKLEKKMPIDSKPPAVAARVASGEMAINSSSAGSGSLLMTFASGSGYGGVVVLRNITFKAATTSGLRTTLLLAVSDLVSAGTLKNLLPATVASFYPFKVR